MSAIPDDLPLRQRVLDPRRSFLVQAPAGAGKTELLIQRYLRLLAVVDEPEEIVAITFTRKAAAEMRSRIMGALTAAPEPGHALLSTTSDLARSALARDRQRGWQLCRHPARLKIGTLDALNGWIAGASPVVSGASALRLVAEPATALYREAARETLRQLGEAGPDSDALADLLVHLDNRVEQLETLIADMLARRDQWLPVIGAGSAGSGGSQAALRQRLESALRRILAHRLSDLAGTLPANILARLQALAVDAAARLQPPVAAPDLTADLPAGAGVPEAGQLARTLDGWRFIIGILLTGDGNWRQRLTVREGFPPSAKREKQTALALIAELAAIDGLAARLQAIRNLPDPGYPEAQWSALRALLAVLPLSAAHLRLVFAARGQTDFIEIAAEALRGLRGGSEAGEYRLRLDARIRHILLDEFQDTSRSQYDLLNGLTDGWSGDEGRTVFLVGDPMQSIYRFRQAEVRLFLETRSRGLPGIEFEFVRLTSNFRSVPALVEWVNEIFPRVLPAADDVLTGAVGFAPARAARPPVEGPGVCLHDLTGSGPGAEGQRVAELVRAALAARPEGTVGILVRSRPHARETLLALQSAGLPCTAVDLLHLGDTSLAHDLLALTRALVHPGDRLAWLAVLRSPGCGLTLADLTTLAGDDPARPVPERIAGALGDGSLADGALLSTDGRARLRRFHSAWERAERRLGRLPLRDVVEGLWLELGGPGWPDADPECADRLLEQIGLHDAGGDCPDVLALGAALARQPARVSGTGGPVQVMTIHKAKGLQFDTVIIPSLGGTTRRDARPVLLWEEIPLPEGEPQLLIAPINAAGSHGDPLYELLWDLCRDQSRAECDRLLYVATTRAAREMHLLGHLERAPDGTSVPPAGSLLKRLWPAVAGRWPRPDPASAIPPPQPADPTAGWLQLPLRRLPADWQRPPPPPAVTLPADPPWQPSPPLIYDWAGAWTRHAGSVVHRCLQWIASEGVDTFPPARIRALAPVFRRMLVRAGVEEGRLETAVARVRDVLLATLADDRGRWLLSAHEEAATELELTVAEQGRFARVVLDRTFVSDGERWIVDYKTSSHEGGDLPAFVASEVARYGPQLTRYRQVMGRLDPRPIRTALYFPLLGVLEEVATPAAGADADADACQDTGPDTLQKEPEKPNS